MPASYKGRAGLLRIIDPDHCRILEEVDLLAGEKMPKDRQEHSREMFARLYEVLKDYPNDKIILFDDLSDEEINLYDIYVRYHQYTPFSKIYKEVRALLNRELRSIESKRTEARNIYAEREALKKKEAKRKASKETFIEKRQEDIKKKVAKRMMLSPEEIRERDAKLKAGMEERRRKAELKKAGLIETRPFMKITDLNKLRYGDKGKEEGEETQE